MRSISPPSAVCRHRGFTLIEVLIVVTILGLLAAIVLPNVAAPVQGSKNQTFATQLREFTTAAQMFAIREDRYPEAAAAGQIPLDFREYLPAGAWDNETPLGGHWDIAGSDVNVVFGLGVDYGPTPPPVALLTEVDVIVDDGDLQTGRFRRLEPGKFYHVMVE